MNCLYSLIDSHAHLDDAAFATDLPEVIGRARAAGVTYIVIPATSAAAARRALDIARRHPGIFVACGLHPNEGRPLTPEEEKGLRAALEEGRAAGLAVAVGECGLDYHYNALPGAQQRELLLWHFGLAREYDLPLILHQREAEPDLRRLIEHEGLPRRGAVLHCFGGSAEYFRWATKIGLYISFTGTLTFEKAAPPGYLNELDWTRTMIETDAPYLAPAPHRGKRNEPAFLREVARALAVLAGRGVDDVACETTTAARALFNLPADFGGAIAYEFKNALYLNVTNRCPNDCTFCLRNHLSGVGGHNLQLKMEPTAAEVIAAAGDPRRYAEVVFCGFGEPTVRWEVVKEIARALKAKGGRIRLDTNGSANLTAGRDVTPEMAGLFDKVSVSVNAAAAEEYERLCRPRAGATAWAALVAFILGAKRYVPAVETTAVALPGLDLAPVKALAASWGVPLRVRPFVAP